MSSTSNDWRSPRTTDNDYWELQYLKHLKRERFSLTAKICVGIAVVLILALVVTVNIADSLPSIPVIILFALNILAAVALAFFSFVQWAFLDSVVASDDREGKLERRPVAEQLRLFALKQEQDFGFLLEITGHASRQEWALDHARAIREKWPADFEEYRVLLQNTDYNRTRKDIFERIDRGYGPGTLLFEEIFSSRQDMRDRVGKSLKRDRATTAIMLILKT